MLKEYQQLVKRKIQEKERHEPNFAKKQTRRIIYVNSYFQKQKHVRD